MEVKGWPGDSCQWTSKHPTSSAGHSYVVIPLLCKSVYTEAWAVQPCIAKTLRTDNVFLAGFLAAKHIYRIFWKTRFLERQRGTERERDRVDPGRKCLYSGSHIKKNPGPLKPGFVVDGLVLAAFFQMPRLALPASGAQIPRASYAS